MRLHRPVQSRLTSFRPVTHRPTGGGANLCLIASAAILSRRPYCKRVGEGMTHCGFVIYSVDPYYCATMRHVLRPKSTSCPLVGDRSHNSICYCYLAKGKKPCFALAKVMVVDSMSEGMPQIILHCTVDLRIGVERYASQSIGWNPAAFHRLLFILLLRLPPLRSTETGAFHRFVHRFPIGHVSITRQTTRAEIAMKKK